MELGSTEAVKEALMAGFGFSILSRISIRHELDQGSIVEVPIRGVKMKRGFYQVFHSRRPFHPIAQAFAIFSNADNPSAFFHRNIISAVLHS